MCTRTIRVCVMCRAREVRLRPCLEWKGETTTYIFGSGWMRKHVETSRYNLTNNIIVRVCEACTGIVRGVESEVMDGTLTARAKSIVTDMTTGMIGVVVPRTNWGGRVFRSLSITGTKS